MEHITLLADVITPARALSKTTSKVYVPATFGNINLNSVTRPTLSPALPLALCLVVCRDRVTYQLRVTVATNRNNQHRMVYKYLGSSRDHDCAK